MQSHIFPLATAPLADPSSELALKALRVSESRYRRLFEAAQDGILILNADTAEIEDVNPYLIRMLGFSRAEFLGRKIWEVGPFADITRSKEMFAELQIKGFVRYEDLPLRTIEGAQVAVEFVSNTYDCDGIKVIQCNVRNITERKSVEEELLRHRLHLEKMVADRTAQLRFLAKELTMAEERERRTIAHDLHDDLGQILAVVKLKLTSLEMPLGDGWQRRLMPQIKEIESMVDRANRSVRSLSMQLSPPVLSQFGLLPALEWLAEEMLRTYGLNVHIYDQCKSLPLDKALSSALFRTVRELLINVSKHAQVDVAEVSIFNDGDKLVISVTDTGIGFDAKQSLLPSTEGGYGLFSVRERLAFMGGKMEIDSRPGKGTAVVLTLPFEVSAISPT